MSSVVTTAQRVQFYLDIVYHLHVTGDHADREQVLASYPFTLRRMYFAHRNECVIELAWLYHPKPSKGVSLRLLIEACRREQRIGLGLRSHLLDELDHHSELVERIRRLRNVVLAHRDDDISYEGAWRKAQISYNDLSLLCVTALETANELARAVGVVELSPDSEFVRDEFNRLFSRLS